MKFAAVLCLVAVSFHYLPEINGEITINWNNLTATFDPPIQLFPAFDARTDTRFQLYTRDNVESYQEILPFEDNFTLDQTSFNKDNPTRVVIHGWLNNGQSDTGVLIKNAYLKKGPFNVIVVDWGQGAMTENYFDAYNRVPEVGAVAAALVQYLNAYAGVDLGKVYVIGHSLGAHASGHAGKMLQDNGKPLLGAVVGLDPADPGFTTADSTYRLASTDAQYVQMIKTSMVGIGVEAAQGNFYPNGGNDQPGCSMDPFCNHGRAYEFFAETINTVKTGLKCSSYLLMGDWWCTGPKKVMGGEPLDTTAQGTYWLKTTSERSPLLG